MFEISYSKDAVKALRRMPTNTAANIRARIMELASDPDAANNNVAKLRGRAEMRLRVGDWRVLFAVDRKARAIGVKLIGPRGSVYQ